MAKLELLNNNERLVSISYDSMEDLIEREPYIESTLNNYLDSQDNKQEITRKYNTIRKDKYHLNFVLSPTE